MERNSYGWRVPLPLHDVASSRNQMWNTGFHGLFVSLGLCVLSVKFVPGEFSQDKSPARLLRITTGEKALWGFQESSQSVEEDRLSVVGLLSGARYLWVVLVVALGLAVVLGACGGKQPSPEDLIQERCTKCHTLAPIEVAQKTRQEWGLTVYRMINEGARLNDREAQAVIDYLSRTFGDENP